MRIGRFALLLCLFAAPVLAHVGSPGSVYSGEAGPYPIRVVINAPSVVPGLAEISVRTSTPGITRVAVRPVKWDAGSAGSPLPDEAKIVSGDPNLYSASLWLMSGGAYSVFVDVDGPAGHGRAIVPIDAVASARLPMDRRLGMLLAVMGLMLAAGVVSIMGAGMREAVLEPGAVPDRSRRVRGWIGMGIGLLIVVFAATRGNAWWANVDKAYRDDMYKPPRLTTTLRGSAFELRIDDQQPGSTRHHNRVTLPTPLIPDHGKLMHLFLIADPSEQVIAHLHPLFIERNHFRGTLPPLPPGEYRLFADVTHESGFSETLVDRIHIAAPVPPAPATDADDSSASQPDPRIVFLNREPIRAGRDTDLRFAVHGGAIEPYMGMTGHAVIVAKDFSVFVHLHPMGTISMASQQKFAQRDGMAPMAMTMPMTAPNGEIAFPYRFPKPGPYRVWVQTKVNGAVVSGYADVNVAG